MDGVTGRLIPAKDSQGLASAVGQIVSDPELAARFGKAGRARVAATFDERFVFARLESFYRELGVSFT